jgi:carboxylesterase
VNGNAFTLPRGNRAVVLVHGFTASTQELEGVAELLAGRDFSVAVPLLAGHNTSFEDFAKTSAADYLLSVVGAYDELEGYESIDVVGISFGAILGIRLASLRAVRRIVLLAPAFRLIGASARLTGVARWHRAIMHKKVEKNPRTGLLTPWDLNDAEACERRVAYDFFAIPQLYSLQRLAAAARKDLRSLTNPLLVIHSRGDRTASFKYARRTFERAQTPQKRLIELTQSGHIISDDVERAIVAREVLEFLES